MKTLKPVNQKSVYASFATLYEKLVNDEITPEKAEQLNASLNGMCRTYNLEIKRADITQQAMRNIEEKNFESE